MNFMESVRHFTFLLSEQNLEFVNGRKSKEPNALVREIEDFSETIQQALATYYSNQCERPTTIIAPNDLERSLITENPLHARHSSARTADVASVMFRESRSRRSQRDNSLSQPVPISESDRDRVIDRARRCLAWAYDPARAPVPGAESMNNEQVSLLACTVGYPECRKVLRDRTFWSIFTTNHTCLLQPFPDCGNYVAHTGASERVEWFDRVYNNCMARVHKFTFYPLPN